MKSSTIRRYFKIGDHLQQIGCLRTRTCSLKERQEALLSHTNKSLSFRERHSQALEQFRSTLRDQDPMIIEHPAQAAQNLITGAGKPILSNSQSKLLLIHMNKCNYRCQKWFEVINLFLIRVKYFLNESVQFCLFLWCLNFQTISNRWFLFQTGDFNKTMEYFSKVIISFYFYWFLWFLMVRTEGEIIGHSRPKYSLDQPTLTFHGLGCALTASTTNSTIWPGPAVCGSPHCS